MSIADKSKVMSANNVTIAENIPKVYDKGKADMDLKLWEMVTANGARESYIYGFSGCDFSGYTFAKPVAPTKSIQQIFYNYIGTEYPKNIDLSQIDTSRAYNSDYYRGYFQYGENITIVPDMGIPALPGLNATYANMKNLITIEKIRVNENTVFTSTFFNAQKLANITFEGTIGQNISFPVSNALTHDTLVHIIEHLKDYGETETHTLTIGSTNLAKLSDTEKAIATQKGWSLA